MYVIRFTIRRSSNQRQLAKHAYLVQRGPNSKSYVGNYANGGSTPHTLDEASRFASEYDATLALIEYFKQVGTWNRAMWVKNPVIVEVD